VELVAYARASAYRLLSLRGLILLARLQVLQGRLTQAGATYEEVAQVLLRSEEVQVLIDTCYYFGLGDLLREWNELEAAHQQLARGMDLLEDMLAIDAEQLWLGYAALARLQRRQGSAEQASSPWTPFCSWPTSAISPPCSWRRRLPCGPARAIPGRSTRRPPLGRQLWAVSRRWPLLPA